METYACPFCSDTFVSEEALQQHQPSQCSKSSRTCTHCGLLFTSKQSLEFHQKQISFYMEEVKSKKTYRIGDLFWAKEMDEQMKYMSQTIRKLQHEVSMLKQSQTYHTSSLVKEYMSTAMGIPQDTLLSWAKNIQVEDKHVIMILDSENRFIDGMKQCLEDVITYGKSTQQTLPICCFTERKKILYIYHHHHDHDPTMSSSSPKWQICTNHLWSCFMEELKQTMLRRYFRWEDENRQRIESLKEYHQERYMNGIQKLIGTASKFRDKEKLLLRQHIMTFIQQSMVTRIKDTMTNV